MGNKLFGVDISGLIAKHVGSGVLTATLHSRVAGTPTAASLTAGTNPTFTDHSCKGFIDQQKREKIGGTEVEAGDVVVVLLGDTINSGNTAPTTKDNVTIESAKYKIRAIDRDPAKAAYTLLCTTKA
jgi:hypothetical protein